MSMGKKVAETFHEFFSNVAKALHISKILYLISGTSQTDPVLQSTEKVSKHTSNSLINIKNIISNSNCTFSFKSETQDNSDNFLKANLDKCHLLISTDENVTLIIKNESISNNSNQKLIIILFNDKFDFDIHVTSLCSKASQKLNVLVRDAHYMNLAQK